MTLKEDTWDAEAEYYSVLDSLAAVYSTYCKKCGCVGKRFGTKEQVAQMLIDEGWTSPARLEIICPTCTEKHSQLIKKQ